MQEDEDDFGTQGRKSRRKTANRERVAKGEMLSARAAALLTLYLPSPPRTGRLPAVPRVLPADPVEASALACV